MNQIIWVMGKPVGNNIIFSEEEAPYAVRTLHRVKLLFLLNHFEPTTTHHFVSIGYSLKSARRIFREFIHYQIIMEHAHLYSLTEKGRAYLKKLIKLPEVLEWLGSEVLLNYHLRPNIDRS